MQDRGRLPGPIRLLLAALGAIALTTGGVATTSACSPLFEEPTIAALGSDAVVVIGTIGEQVDGGRLFHVQRAFSGGVTSTPMVIAFKEGPAIGDCSYPVTQGARLLIATVRDDAGRVPVDLVTLQADPESPDGQRYLAEATALFGPGTVPGPLSPPGPPAPSIALVVLVGLAIIAGSMLAWRAVRRSRVVSSSLR
jgi:hypothetical protein